MRARQCKYFLHSGLLQRLPGGYDYQISRHSAHESGKVDGPTHRPSLPPGNIPGTHFCWMLSQTQGHRTTGRIMSPGIETACSAVSQPTATRVAPVS